MMGFKIKTQNILPHILWSGLFLLLAGCNHSSRDERLNYAESKPSFFELRNGDWLTNEWIRKPENLLAVHETFKKVGYLKLITDDMLVDNPLIIQDIYINKPGRHLLDSLEVTYNQEDVNEKYYKEFWQRRKAEGNDSVVYIIIKDINFVLKNKMGSVTFSQTTNSELVNDTLVKLLEIEFRRDSMTRRQAQQDFETLRQLGFHQSAYNLLFEAYRYQGLAWNRDSMEKTLEKSNKFTYPWFQDDTK